MTRITGSIRTLVWTVAVALAAVVASERVYWYWGGIDVEQLGVLASFYGVAVIVAMAALAASPGSGPRRAVLGGAVFALVVEGIITPVIYEDGPLPLLYLMFVGWHGLLAFVGFVYAIRRWALERRSLRLAAGAAVTGIGWGLWALASAVPDRETAEEIAADGGGSADVLDPSSFGVYAAWTGLALLVAHVVADRFWPRVGWRLSKSGRVAAALAVVWLTATLVVPAVPWAPIKLLALALVLRSLLRRTASPAGSDTVIDELAGRCHLPSLLGLALLPVTAAGTYAVLWPLRESTAFEAVFWSLIGAQVFIGVGALIWAVRRPRNNASESDDVGRLPVRNTAS
ncbi:MAG: hypothetical protein AB8G26_14130 [Ilumatobacter sp.]